VLRCIRGTEEKCAVVTAQLDPVPLQRGKTRLFRLSRRDQLRELIVADFGLGHQDAAAKVLDQVGAD
jgi:hypothetical protein